MSDLEREQAQQRAARITAFREELDELRREQVLQLSEAQEQAVTAHHRQLLTHYRQTLDIDADARARQLSLGMRLASLLGALALAAGLFFLFYQFWGLFDAAAQVAILLGCCAFGYRPATPLAITPNWPRCWRSSASF